MTDRELERLADLIAVRLAPMLTSGGSGLVDAATLAGLLGVSRRTVYARAEELGAVRIGTGPRARMRFDADRAREALGRAPHAPPPPRRARQAKGSAAVPLLPIREGPA